MNVTVYSKSGCAQCVFTKKFLASKEIKFEEKRVDENEDYLEEVTKMGYHSLPVVTINQEESFVGYNLDKLNKLVLEWQK